MRQRVALVRTLATQPKLLLLDEPFSALDYQTKLKLEDLVLSTLKEHGKTAILVTHDIGEAIAMSDTVILMANNPGRIFQTFKMPESLRNLLPSRLDSTLIFQLLFSKYGRSWRTLNKMISNKKHLDYLLSIKKEKQNIRTVQVLIFLLFFSVWEISSRQGWINPLLFSSPSKIGDLFLTKATDGSLYIHVAVTLGETVLGFILGTLLGTLIAAVLWWSPFLSKVMDPYLVILNAMPKVALGPILIVAIGPNFGSIIAMGILISVIITTLVVYTAFQNVDANYVKVVRSFGGGKKQCFKEVILPACFPTIISCLKVNVGLSWVGVIVGEFLVSKQGLGYMIIYGFQVFNFTLVLLSLLIIALLATIMYQAVGYLEKRLIKHHS